MNQYIWQSKSWPDLTWDNNILIEPLSHCRLLQGKLLGQLASIDREMGLEAYAELLVEETVQTAYIEGQMLDRSSVRSSVTRRLGLEAAGLPVL